MRRCFTLMLLPALGLLGACAAPTTTSDPASTDANNEPAAATDSPASSGGIEETKCVAFASVGMTEHVAKVSLETGKVEIGAEVPADLFADTTSIGQDGDGAILTCAGTVVRVTVGDGAVESTNMECDAVTTVAGSIWVASPGNLSRYADFAAIKAKTPLTSVASPGATRLAPARDGSLLGSSHMTDTVMRVSSATGAATSSVTLEGYNGWILGLAQTGASGDIVIAPWYTEGGLIVFDAKTGARKSKIPLASKNQVLHGLSCPQ